MVRQEREGIELALSAAPHADPEERDPAKAAANAVAMVRADAEARDLVADEARLAAQDAEQALTLRDRFLRFFGKSTPAVQHAEELRERAASLSWAADMNRPGPSDLSAVRRDAMKGADRAALRHARWMTEHGATLLAQTDTLNRIESALMWGDADLARRVRRDGVRSLLATHEDKTPASLRVVPMHDRVAEDGFSLPHHR